MIKPMRSVIIYLNRDSKTVLGTILNAIADEYEKGVEIGYVYDSGVQVAHWLHYEGKLDQIPGNVDVLITQMFDCDEIEYADYIRNFNGYIEPTWFVAKSELRREQLMADDYQVWREHYNCKGALVVKKSGCPFKSGNLCNTVKRIDRNPYSGLWGFTFEDDDSVVDIKQLKTVMHTTAPELTSAQKATGAVRFDDVVDKSITIRDYFKSTASHNNFNEALDLYSKFTKLKWNKKLPEEYNDLSMTVSYGEGNIFMSLMKGNRYEKEIIPCVDRDCNDQRATVLKRHLKWFDFIKEL